jgi:pimeloyl-ACP methyl ester carboxylesterase
VVTETDLALDDGRTLHVYDTGAGDGAAGLAVFWHHGTPNTGAPPEPLFAAAAERGIRWVSHDRPGYGGSTPHPGRDVASAAADVATVADALGIDRFAVMGHSSGSPHALACAAVLPGRPEPSSSGPSAGPLFQACRPASITGYGCRAASDPLTPAQVRGGSAGIPQGCCLSLPRSGWTAA